MYRLMQTSQTGSCTIIYDSFYFNEQGRLQASLAEHRALMAALKAHDPRRAEQLMREHMANGKAAASLS